MPRIREVTKLVEVTEKKVVLDGQAGIEKFYGVYRPSTGLLLALFNTKYKASKWIESGLTTGPLNVIELYIPAKAIATKREEAVGVER